MKMTKSSEHAEDDALAGVSALIIFIALVLVSAIAAGVILDTAGFLQEKASTTGTESTSKVSDGLDIVDTVGVVTLGTDNPGGADLGGYSPTPAAYDPDSPNVSQVRLDVLKAPGAEPVNLEDATLKVTTNQGSTTLAFNTTDEVFQPNDADPVKDGGEPTAPDNDGINFSVKDIRDTDASYPVKNDQTDRFQVRVNFTGELGTSLEPISPGTNVDLELTTAAGAQSFTSISIPRTLPQEDGASLSL